MSEESEKACAYVNAACTRATLRAMGMVARNKKCTMNCQHPMYLEEDFLKIIKEEGIEYNDVVSVLFHK